MRLQRIYSSKIYLTSSRKDRIHAAINDPYNQELVKQLSEYLDDEGQLELKQAIAEEDQEQSTADNNENSNMSDGSGAPNDTGVSSGGSAPTGGRFSGNVMDDFGEDELADVEPVSPESDAGDETAEPDVAAATKTSGSSVMATTATLVTTDMVLNDCETIKGTLNSREATCGVTRLQVKDQELWVYYTDDVNLNDKMIEVIELLNSSGYTYLAFSRLARSNNAIVFDIDLNAEQPVKSIQELTEET